MLDGSVATGGTDAVRKISVSGNLYLTGTLRTADLGPARQGIDLEVSGTLYLTGTLDTSGARGRRPGGRLDSSGGGPDRRDGPALQRRR